MTGIFNELFEIECVGYRFVNMQITDIINDEEIKEIEEALNTKYSACSESINKALNLLYNRDTPLIIQIQLKNLFPQLKLYATLY